MTRAEQEAREIHCLALIEANRIAREQWDKGYKQAEKDLALTKDDVWCIFNLVRELQTKYPATEGCLQEVADIFNAQHNEHKVE